MKKTLGMVVASVAVALMGAKLISQDAALVSGALTELKFEMAPGPPGLVGAPPKLKVTKQTIEFLQKLQKEGKVVEVQNNGALKIIEAKR